MRDRVALLDVDGTLVASNDAHAKAWSDALRAFGFDIDPVRIGNWVGMGGDKILPRVDPSLNDSSEPGASIVRERARIFRSKFLGTLQPTRGARSFLARLEAEGWLRVVATSAKRREMEEIVRAARLDDLIDCATTSDDAERSKPDADIVVAALQKAQSAPDTAIYVGDTPYDVAAARRAGVAAAGVRCGGWHDRDLAGAIAVYDDPAGIVEHFNASVFAAPRRRCPEMLASALPYDRRRL